MSYVNDTYFDPNYNVVSKNSVKAELFKNAERVVFKLDSSKQGKGIYFFDRNNFDPDAIQKLGNGLFQSFVTQHANLGKFSETSVATLRLTTVLKDDGETSLRASYLRFGIGQDTHVESSSAIRVPIDIVTGEFDQYGYLTSWLKTDQHPTSGAPFKDSFIPAFEQCKDKVISLHKKIPQVRCIGWDVAIDKDENVVLLEWNGGHNDIKFSKATQGPCFADLNW